MTWNSLWNFRITSFIIFNLHTKGQIISKWFFCVFDFLPSITDGVHRNENFEDLVPSMWFWSVSWSTNCPVYFSLFLVDQKNFVQSKGIFVQFLNLFWSGSAFRYTKKKFWYTKKKLGGPKKSETDQKFPETEQIFFWSTKKKGEIDWTMGRPRDWPKPHGRDLCVLWIFLFFLVLFLWIIWTWSNRSFGDPAA